MDHPKASPGLIAPDITTQPPAKTLRVYRRILFGRKHLFATSGSDPAQYFVVNPIPHKHADTWKPVFYRGDNPKYTPSSKAISRAWRTSMWFSFRIELGDGVHEVLENKRRVKERRHYERKKKFRRWFRMKEKPPKKELEEVKEVEGLVLVLKMRRAGFLGRTLKWKLGDEEYRWTGTRSFLPNWAKRCKGISHDMKLVKSDKTVVATFEKDRFAAFRPSERSEGPPNRKKSFLGKLRIFSSADPTNTTRLASGSGVAIDLDEMTNKEKKENKNLNLGGTHSGDLTEEAIVFTCWIAIEAEHRLRHKIIDLLEEIAEHFKE